MVDKIDKGMSMKNHYTYLITYPDGKQYHGLRSSECLPEEDVGYWGSSKITPGTIGAVKEILTTHDSREEAAAEEVRYHQELNVWENDDYYNRCNAGEGLSSPARIASKVRYFYTGDDAINMKEIIDLYNSGKIDSCEKDKMLSAYITDKKAEKELCQAFNEVIPPQRGPR